MPNINDDFFNSNNASKSVRDNSEEIIVARKAVGKSVGLVIWTVLFIAGGVFALIKVNELDILLYVALGCFAIGLILLLSSILELKRPMNLVLIKGNKIWIYKKGEYDLGEVVKVTSRRYLQSFDLTKPITSTTTTTHGTLSIKLDSGKKFNIKHVENVRRTAIKLNELLGLK